MISKHLVWPAGRLPASAAPRHITFYFHLFRHWIYQPDRSHAELNHSTSISESISLIIVAKPISVRRWPIGPSAGPVFADTPVPPTTAPHAAPGEVPNLTLANRQNGT